MIPWLTSGPVAVTNDTLPWYLPISKNHIPQRTRPLRPSLKPLKVTDPVCAVSLSLYLALSAMPFFSPFLLSRNVPLLSFFLPPRAFYFCNLLSKPVGSLLAPCDFLNKLLLIVRKRKKKRKEIEFISNRLLLRLNKLIHVKCLEK